MRFLAGSIHLALIVAVAALVAAGCARAPDEDRPLFPAPVHGVWGYIDDRGRMILPPRWENVLPFSEGLAGVKRKGRWGFIDRHGNEVIPPRYQSVQSFSHGHATVATGAPDHPVGVVTTSGTLVLDPPEPLEAAGPPDELTSFHLDIKLGYKDKEGRTVIEPRYNQGGPFKEGLAPVQLEGHWMWINRSGAITADFPAGIAFAEPLTEGLSLVSADRDGGGRGFGFVDRNGHWAIKPAWDEAEPFDHGLARVGRWKENKVVYINPSGDVVWREP